MMPWYISRLASMGPAEIIWRMRSAACVPIDWTLYKIGGAVPAPKWAPFAARTFPVQLHDSGCAMECIQLFDLELPIDFEFDWHYDYCNNKKVKRQFSGSLDIRNTETVGDIKYIWEVNRHQFLSSLAYAQNGSRHTDTLLRVVRSWIKDNPYLSGINWTSSLELALRVVSWALMYPRIAQDVDSDRDFRERWLASIYLHLTRIANRPSLFSSANNHLIGELVGLYVGASCFPFWGECAAWRDFAHQALERQILLQVSADGVNREQAISYHLFTLELLLLAFVIGRNCERPFSDTYAERLRAMLRFLNAVATSTGDIPWYGDSDDARGFVFAQDESALEVTTQMGGLLFDEPTWLRFRNKPTAAAHALVPDLLGALSTPAASSEPQCELFEDGGFACVRSDNDKIRLLMDFGPLGYTNIAAHGHSDALSIWLAVGDEYLLIDAGTYAYHSHPEWRNYFRGTAAHNTVRVDGCNQSKIAGRFLWSTKAKARLTQFQEYLGHVIIGAEHEGYTRLDDPVVHRRTVDFDRTTGSFTLADSFCCAHQHTIEQFFHLHEDTAVIRREGGEVELSWHGCRIFFSSSDSLNAWEVVRGSEAPMLGWRSYAFNQKQPISTLRLRSEIDGNTIIVTKVDVQP
jgi:uncharacterized heparinase superfamily protein